MKSKGKPELVVVCTPFEARLTERGCRLNQQKAQAAIDMVEGGTSVFLVDNEDLDRMMLCGTCPKAGLDAERAARCAAQVVRELMETWKATEHMDWWRGDGEVARERKRVRDQRYRQKHRKRIALYRKQKRLEDKAAGDTGQEGEEEDGK
jgi:hypothetical protein